MSDLRSHHDSPSEPDLSNRQIGNYQVGRRLGRGGMADVYLAEQMSLRRQIALKVLHRNLAGDESYVRRFHNEAQAAAALIHANIVQIHEVGCVEGIHFIAQEYVDGQNLKQFLSRRGPLDARQAISIMRQVGAALQKAGQQGIIHRDIKPENIMLTASGEVKVADFGLARASRDGARVDLTQSGMTMGTPLYMSPEQVEGRSIDPRSDLYSFGVTCYEMLSGRPPFEADNPITVAVHHLKTEPERLEMLRKDLPEGLCRVVHKLMAKVPDQRYPTAGEMLRDLRSVIVEGAEEWSWADEGLVDQQWETEAVRRIAATQQLATVMARERRLPRVSQAIVLVLALAALAFGAGSAAAWLNRPPSLLEFRPSSLAELPKKETVQAQFFEAMQHKTEQAWKAVIAYFPPEQSPENAEYARRANLQLAYLYDDEGRTEDAVSLLTQLAADGSDGLVQMSALTRLANIHERRKEQSAADDALARLAVIIATSLNAEEELRDNRRQLESLRLQRQLEEYVEAFSAGS